VIPTRAARADLVYLREYSIEQFGPDVADDISWVLKPRSIA